MSAKTKTTKPAPKNGNGAKKKNGSSSTAHSAKVQALLKVGNFSPKSELTADQKKRINALPKDATARSVEAAMHGKPAAQKQASDPARSLAASANEVPGPKYPIAAKTAAGVKKRAASAPKVTDAKLKKFAASGTGLSKGDAEALAEFAQGLPAGTIKHTGTTDQRQVARVLIALAAE